MKKRLRVGEVIDDKRGNRWRVIRKNDDDREVQIVVKSCTLEFERYLDVDRPYMLRTVCMDDGLDWAIPDVEKKRKGPQVIAQYREDEQDWLIELDA